MATKAEDEKYLADMTATCSMKASDFESRQQLSLEELEAIQKAIEIISSDAVSGSAEKHLPALVQKSALAQLRGDAANPLQVHAAEFLRDQGTLLKSRVLSALAVRVADD